MKIRKIIPSKFFDIKGASEYLGVHSCTIRKMIDDSKLKAINIGKGKYKIYRIRKEDLDTALTVIDLFGYHGNLR